LSIHGLALHRLSRWRLHVHRLLVGIDVHRLVGIVSGLSWLRRCVVHHWLTRLRLSWRLGSVDDVALRLSWSRSDDHVVVTVVLRLI